MGITADRIKSLGLIDAVLKEPLGGAHRDMEAMAAGVKKALQDSLARLDGLAVEELVEARYKRFAAFGSFKE
jgi:acetyl-CoA carboxylase carboxyl transferase subunit alpha